MKSTVLSLTLIALSSFTVTAQTTARKTTATTQVAKPAASTQQANARPAVAAQPTKPAAQTPTRTAPSVTPSLRTAYLNAGIGLAAYMGGGIPLGVSYEKTIRDNVSVGGSVDFARYGRSYGRYTFIYAGARGSYHLGELLGVSDNKFDPYIGASLGFRHVSYRDSYGYGSDYYNSYGSGLYLGIHLGSRYMFSEKLGGFAEVGYGISALRLGVSAKF